MTIQRFVFCRCINIHSGLALEQLLKTVAAMGGAAAKKSGRDVVAKMKALPTDDDAFGPGRVRADGRGEFPAYLFEVKSAAESKGEWDLYKLVRTTPAADVLHPLNDKCKFPVG